MACVFGMVSTRKSQAYTPYGVSTFYANTPLESVSRFILIDNDGSLEPEDYREYPKLEIHAHKSPKGFAANANYAMSLAASEKADFVFLNNDMIFTEGWLPPLLELDDAILGSVSNWDIRYRTDNLVCERVLELSDYVGREADLAFIVDHHRRTNSGFRPVFFIGFYCVRIPYGVYSEIGPLDEEYGTGGAEDNDYCIRAHLAGIPVGYGTGSFILHFGGKSTRNVESQEQLSAREAAYIARFRSKWGERLTRLALFGDRSVFGEVAGAKEAAEKGDYKRLVELLIS
jgi:GT2 family glycosyltransferase